MYTDNNVEQQKHLDGRLVSGTNSSERYYFMMMMMMLNIINA